ncbi:MAG: hypothetical protein P1V21_02025 [Rhizobiaceae bacterium]|nr:hypothetical protein [Rhizobiaceae bacterium]
MTYGDEDLLAKLAKLENLFRRAGTAGERDAAGAAIGRVKDRLDKARDDHESELKFSLPDVWSVRLFVAVCRKHGVRPYRYPRQRRTTVMVRTQEKFFDKVVWTEFSKLHTELMFYFEDTVEHLISTAMQSDGDDSALEVPQLR